MCEWVNETIGWKSENLSLHYGFSVHNIWQAVNVPLLASIFPLLNWDILGIISLCLGQVALLEQLLESSGLYNGTVVV